MGYPPQAKFVAGPHDLSIIEMDLDVEMDLDEFGGGEGLGLIGGHASAVGTVGDLLTGVRVETLPFLLPSLFPSHRLLESAKEPRHGKAFRN